MVYCLHFHVNMKGRYMLQFFLFGAELRCEVNSRYVIKENYELWTTQEEIFSGKPMVDYLFQHSTNVIYIQSAIKEFLTFLL